MYMLVLLQEHILCLFLQRAMTKKRNAIKISNFWPWDREAVLDLSQTLYTVLWSCD